MQRGSLKVVKNRAGAKVWRAQWRDNGRGRTRILGRYAEMSRDEARTELGKILEPLNARYAAVKAAQAVSLRRYVEDEYLVVRNRVWKDSTRGTTEQIIETHILKNLGHRSIPSITRRELQALLDSKAEAGLSSSVVGHIRWQLVATFAMAKGDGIITVDPTDGLVTPRCSPAKDKRIISVGDMRRGQMVLEIRERLIFRLAVYEGMRPGEIVGLQIGDFGLDGMFHVRRRIYRGVVDTPKSRRSKRPIPPTEPTRLLLMHWMDMLADRRQEAWLFPSEAGTPLSYSNVYRRRIQPALAKVGLGNANFQVLRRTWVTEFAEVERDPNVRAQLGGHSVDVHENEYRQAQPAVLKRAMRKLDKRLQ